MIEPIMNLDLPVVGETVSPDWANMFVSALLSVAEHDHTVGSGVKLTPDALNINSDLALNSNDLTTARSVRFISNVATLSEVADLNCIFVYAGNFYYKNNSGQNVKLTEGGSINLSTVGTIGGDYGQSGIDASAVYADLTKTFSWLRSSGVGANMAMSNVSIAYPSAGAAAVTLGAPAAAVAHTITLPPAAPATNDSVMKFTTGGVATYGRYGLIPLGSVLPTFPHLTGAYACTATTSADTYGFVQCNGQTIIDSTSLMNGQAVPNINGDVFLMGNATSGSAGGANTKALSHTHSVSVAHTHGFSYAHSHGTLNGLTVASGSALPNYLALAHTHGMTHNHQALYLRNIRSLYGSTNSSGTAPTFSTSGELIYSNVGMSSTTGTATSGALGTATSATLYTSGVLSPPSGTSYNDAATGSGLGNFEFAHTHITNSQSASSGTTSSQDTATFTTGAVATTYDIRPAYITARYIMRIK